MRAETGGFELLQQRGNPPPAAPWPVPTISVSRPGNPAAAPLLPSRLPIAWPKNPLITVTFRKFFITLPAARAGTNGYP